jgi:hypothetical protein
VIRLADLTVTQDVISDVRFEQCQIIGPAVLAVLDKVSFLHSAFDAPDASALFWPLPPEREIVMGAIGVQRVEFFACQFSKIGLAVPEDRMEQFLQGFGAG